MSLALPTPPPDSPFRVGYDEHGRVRLSWRPPYSWRSELVGWTFLVGFTSLLVFFFSRAVGPGAAFCVALAMGCAKVLHVLHKLRSERLTLGEAVLRYEWNDPGWLAREEREVTRAEAGTIRLEWLTDSPGRPPRVGRRPRQGLALGQGAERLEIGTDLRGPDRDWLAEVLRAWGRGGERPASGAGAGPGLPLAIEVEHEGAGVLRLRWQPNGLGLMSARRRTAVCLSGWLLGWGLGGAGVLMPTALFLYALLRTGAWCLLLPLAALAPFLWVWVSAGRKAVRELLPLLRRPTEESLTLTPSGLHYQPGRYFDASRLAQLQECFKQAGTWYPGRYWEGQAVRSGPPRDVPLSELGAVRLERTDERPRLTIDHGAESFEVGRGLREPDREWLAEALRAWAAAAAGERPPGPESVPSVRR